MKIGITGPPRSGKSTLLKILVGRKDHSLNMGVFRIPDDRLDDVAHAFSSKKITYPEFTFLDLGDFSRFEKKDSGVLHDIDLFIVVAASFFSDTPLSAIDSQITDMILFDLEVVQTRIERLKKEKRAAGQDRELVLLERLHDILSEGRMLYSDGIGHKEVTLLSGLSLVTVRPVAVVLNLSDENLPAQQKDVEYIRKYCSERGMPVFEFFGKTELELMDFDEGEKKKFLEDLGDQYNIRRHLAAGILRMLGLITFFTAGPKETKGWHLRAGEPVVEAAGKIHSDLKKGFIRAEVISYGDFIKCGSLTKAREDGLLRLEGKNYIVKDGDILNIRFNI
jgi:ribosome-binding ATPase YchF (GTP1/OBG family)